MDDRHHHQGIGYLVVGVEPMVVGRPVLHAPYPAAALIRVRPLAAELPRRARGRCGVDHLPRRLDLHLGRTPVEPAGRGDRRIPAMIRPRIRQRYRHLGSFEVSVPSRDAPIDRAHRCSINEAKRNVFASRKGKFGGVPILLAAENRQPQIGAIHESPLLQ